MLVRRNEFDRGEGWGGGGGGLPRIVGHFI